MILVSLSPMIADAVMPGIVIVKSVAFRLPMRFRLMLLVDDVLLDELEVVVPVPFVPVVGVVFTLLFSEILVLVGGVMPKVRVRSLLTCITTISITTSGFALSRSSTNFCASAI